MQSRLLKAALLTLGCLAIASTVYGQPFTLGQTAKFQGLITARNGADMTVKSQSGDNVVVVLTDNTKVEVKEGLFGARRKQTAVMGLIPGLKVDVHGVGDQGGRVIATSVSFSGKDLETAQAIQAGLDPTQKQLQATDQSVAANQKAIGTTQQQVKQVAGDEADLGKAVRRAWRLRREAPGSRVLPGGRGGYLGQWQERSRQAGAAGQRFARLADRGRRIRGFVGKRRPE